ncbi:fimbrial outer membrane usher protein [Pantoea vagans]|uniref:fimbrial outer membrane usher protein n=1 Tax=Pantoea vagans TaxID=470934 RepID=UPI00396A00DB
MTREQKSVKSIRFQPGNIRLLFLPFCASFTFSMSGHAEEYYFDPSLFKGSAFGQNIGQFNQHNIMPGNYYVDIYVNNKLIKSGVTLTFLPEENGQPAEPCLSPAVAESLRLRSLNKYTASDGCQPLNHWSSSARWQFDQASLRLQLTIPDAELIHLPRGTIPVAEWDKGITALFIRHNTNYNWTKNTVSGYQYQYLWSGMTAGTNIDNWQLRHQGNLRFVDNNVTGSDIRYTTVRTWLQRPIEPLDSLLTLGDSYTESSQFGSLAYNGLKLTTDERMRPQSRRGYAPEIRGMASTSARVIVRQLNRVIYETSVAPGPFVINDLYNTRSQGDLDVEVVEANGKTSSFTVPYASVPDSVRPGNWHYSVALGRVRQFYSVNNTFFEGLLQRGISNRLTATAGSRLAQDYQAWLLGGVWTSSAGAVGLNTIFSDARVDQNSNATGWRAELSYSKTFATGTNLVLAAYRYSTSGYRDLQDVLGVRRQQDNGISYYSDTLHQRNNFSVTLSQSMENYGLISLSASTADYYNNRSRITQLQLGYNNSWKNISYGLNVARQRTTWNYDRYGGRLDDGDNTWREKYTENTIALNVSVPLNWSNNTASVAYNYNQSKETRNSTLSLTGSSGENNQLSWSLYGGAEQTQNSGSYRASFGGNVQQNTRMGGIRANYGQGDNYRQAGLGLSGTLLIHPGGVTAGPYTSDTFALIHAEGAQGASVRNGQGAVIDRFGYAILPSLTPYQANTVSLDTRYMNADAELSGGSQRVVPYAGSVTRINFATLQGKAVLIALKNEDDDIPPMGTEVRDADNTVIGIIGQGGQLYARVPHDSGTLKVNWQYKGNKTCFVNYQITGRVNEDIVRLDAVCRKG